MSESFGYEGDEAPQPSEAANKEQEATDAAYTAFFSSPNGQLVLLDLLHESGHYVPSFQPGDPHATAYYEGKRSIYLHILKRAALDDFKMIDMARTRAKRSTR